MIILYNLSIFLMRAGLRLAALFHPKAKSFVTGRKGLLQKIQADYATNTAPVVWVHCASLGEFEQGRPVIEGLRKVFPKIRIVLTFFSPSGYDVRKHYQGADHVYYLPWDTAANAKRFVKAIKPTLAIFVKYEFWHHYTQALAANRTTILSISSIFRPDQLFFKPYGGFYRKILKRISHFFVQNDESLKLLKAIGLNHCTRSGDTRFDRVYQIVKQAEELPTIQNFKNHQKIFVVGSSWSEDIDVLIPLINENRMKFIIAPHEISEQNLISLERALQVKSIRYSQTTNINLEDFQVLIIDNVGMLSKLYRYGEFAFIGGAYGKGLHNILEAACYGVPIFFGNKNYTKFKEAVDLINRGGAFDVADYTDLKMKYEMVTLPESFLLACEVTRQYVEENLGATEKILTYCEATLRAKNTAA
ncbi:3-deoxy-D-manno-octulosonic acid transferase [Pseudochryseolinea flava]|uniref:3-deoxy-D-manno-octulosonic acid transferase n=1 Tax=Pseudochryseolinea flava TaxID=2059302 RepID=A0A364XXS4_9BACT|nr:glycosyltransferase N-terminal domain-containing protein [Pseudochryseolinea flava]RAV99097.1 3-deoxy-D-manno-octulosonic acid transferase [Pseudochryseolinea flava]